MKRSGPIARRTELERGSGPARRSELKRTAMKQGRPKARTVDGLTEPTGETRAFVLGVFGQCCAACGRPGDLVLHHRKLKSRLGHHRGSNLLPVHVDCHRRIHAEPALSEAIGLILPSTATPSRSPARVIMHGHLVRFQPVDNPAEVASWTP